LCAGLDVPLTIARVEVRDDGDGPEAAAREARHAAFERELRDGETLALAHHRDDQAETFLLRALRGSGADGLGAMRAWRAFGRGWLWRPLLAQPREALRDHATTHGLPWIEDPSNADPRFDRNFLRQRVLPLLRERWPRVDASFARSAALGAEAADALGGALHSAGGVRYAPVLARGRWEGPGAYGAAGKYRYQLVSARLERLSVQDATVGELIDRPTSYDGRLIRVAGGLLVHEQSALLVDRLGPGGVPAPDARQVKLRAPLADRALLDRLKGPAGGAVRYGQVQIEGFWRAGALVPLSISIIT
jgi:hypothetical protein